jgi:hypothetical protein
MAYLAEFMQSLPGRLHDCWARVRRWYARLLIDNVRE